MRCLPLTQVIAFFDVFLASLILIVGLEKVKPERFIETWSAASSILIEEEVTFCTSPLSEMISTLAVTLLRSIPHMQAADESRN